MSRRGVSQPSRFPMGHGRSSSTSTSSTMFFASPPPAESRRRWRSDPDRWLTSTARSWQNSPPWVCPSRSTGPRTRCRTRSPLPKTRPRRATIPSTQTGSSAPFRARPGSSAPSGPASPESRVPVHLFWGAMDLAVTRFSGREAPEHPGGIPNLPDWVTREAYSHEVFSVGFWPGSASVPTPIFYAYAYPAPAGFERSEVQPAAARWDTDLSEFVLPYDALRKSGTPEADLMAFLESTWEAAAELGDWDRTALEWGPGEQPRSRGLAAPESSPPRRILRRVPPEPAGGRGAGPASRGGRRTPPPWRGPGPRPAPTPSGQG
jgi:hypothetical protein